MDKHTGICKIEIRQPQEGEQPNKDYVIVRAVVSSPAVDTHGSYMTEKTLQNFADSLQNDEIQLKDSHTLNQGFGVSTKGELVDGKVIGDFKVFRNLELSDSSFPNSNTFIQAIETGLITKTSVGFTGGRYLCSICNDKYFSATCRHFAGEEYEVVKENDEKETVTMVVAVDDAHLIEVSLVSSGANPDAMIIEKAHRCHAEGTLPINVKTRLEETHGVRFADKTPDTKSTNDGGNIVEDQVKELEEKLQQAETERDAAKDQVTALQELADCGKAAREYMRSENLQAFKVSRGESLKESEIERFEKRASSMNFSDLVLELEHLKTLAPAPAAVEPGSKTTQPDNSGQSDESDEGKTQTTTKAAIPPHWMKRRDK